MFLCLYSEPFAMPYESFVFNNNFSIIGLLLPTYLLLDSVIISKL